MIKELTENPDKKFRRVGEDRELYVGVYNNFVVWEGDYALETGGEPFEIYTDLEWEEVKQPVDFMTAFKAFRSKNKNIYCIREGIRANYYEDSENTYFFHEDDIDNGKWYIED